MRRWCIRLLGAAGVVAALTGSSQAAPPPPRATVTADPIATETYRAASPYNATVVGRPQPNPVLNYPNFTLGCEWPNQNFDKYCPADCFGGGCGQGCGHEHGCGYSNGCNSGCGSQCGAILGRHDSGCGCNRGCSHEGCGHQSCGSCDSGCGNSCRAIFQHHDFGRGRCCEQSSCGGDTGCSNGGCLPTAPAPTAPTAPVAPPAKPIAGVKPIAAAPIDSDIQLVGGWWLRQEKDPAPVQACESCPQHGPPPIRRLPTPASLGCTGCSTWHSEYVFIFGSCRQFFGEPTHDWWHHSQQ